MDLTKMQFDNITLLDIAPDDEDELRSLAKLADDEGMEHGLWVARALRVNEEQLNRMRNGLDPDEDEELSDDDRLQNVYDEIIELLEEYYDSNKVKLWKIYCNDDAAGYMIFISCFGAPYIHFLTEEAFSDIEDKADLMVASITAAIPFLDFYFKKFSTQAGLWLYPFQEDVEDIEFAIGQIGFSQLEDLDYYDYNRLAAFILTKEAYEAYRDSLEE